MDLGIAGRTAAVAAGSAGLGFAVAAALIDEGVRVAICGRGTARLDAAVHRLGDSAVGIVADMNDPDEARRFADEATERLGATLDIVVANAGGPPMGTASGTGIDAYRAALELNCLSSVALCAAAVGSMRSQRWGRILAITSVGARQPIAALAASSVARAAVTSYIKVLAAEVAGDGVTANTIQPGPHDTERIRQLSGGTTGPPAGIPAGRLGDPSDFGRVAAFLCSEPASYICGAAVTVDGGFTQALQ